MYLSPRGVIPWFSRTGWERSKGFYAFQVCFYGAGVAFYAFQADAEYWGAVKKGSEGGFGEVQYCFCCDVQEVVSQGK